MPLQSPSQSPEFQDGAFYITAVYGGSRDKAELKVNLVQSHFKMY